MGNEPAGVIESGVKKGLHAAATLHPPDPRAEQHVGLPDLIAEFGLKLLVRRWGEQLLFRKAALFEEAVEQRPIEQCIDGNRRPFRMGDVVGAAGDLLGPAREFAAGKSFDYQLSD